MKSVKGESRSVRDATAHAADLGLPIPTDPGNEVPTWPHSLTDLSEDDIAEHLAYWTAMLGYVNYHLAIADSERKIFEMQQETLLAKHTIEGIAMKKRDIEHGTEHYTSSDRAHALSVTQHKMSAILQKDVQHAIERYLVHFARWKMLSALSKDYEQKYSAVSREMSRRADLYARERKQT